MNSKKLLPRKLFFKRIARNASIGFFIIAISLGIGMWGYRHFEQMSWVEAYENASMILSGMGPVSELHTEKGKVFAGTYALFSGIVFLVVIAVTFAPIFHRILHKYLIQGSQGPK